MTEDWKAYRELNEQLAALQAKYQELESKLSAMEHAHANMAEALEACEIASGWKPGDTPLPVYIEQMRAELEMRRAEP